MMNLLSYILKAKMLWVIIICLASPLLFAEIVKKEIAPDIISIVNRYYSAMEEKDLDALGKIVDPKLLVLEGTYKNISWDDFRNNHIGPEMKEWKSLKTINRKIVHSEVIDRSGYVVVDLSYEITYLTKEVISMISAETFVLIKSEKGPWLIKHIHSSSKKVAPIK